MKKPNSIKGIIKDFLVATPLIIVFLSLTSFSFHNETVEVDFNKQITPSEVEAIVDKELTEHETANK